MRLIVWTLVFILTTLCAAWIVIFSNWNLQDNPIASRFAIAFFVFVSVGPYWMFFDSLRTEKKLTRKMWLFFVPGGFIWHYFEHFRPRRSRALEE